MQETLSIQQMYDKYHALWPASWGGTPQHHALLTIASVLREVLFGYSTPQRAAAALEAERDEDDEGVRYLYHPVIRDLRAMPADQNEKHGGRLDECEQECHDGYSAHDDNDEDDVGKEPDECPGCGDDWHTLAYSKKLGWLCASCYADSVDEQQEEEEEETVPEDAHKHLDQLSNARVYHLVADAALRLRQITDWELVNAESLKQLRDNWALLQALMPRYIQDFAAAVPVVPVGCQCVLCKEQ